MENRAMIKKTLLLVLVLTVMACFLASCDLKEGDLKVGDFDVASVLPEKTEDPEPRELIGAEGLSETDRETIDLIDERVNDFYRDVSNKNYDFVRMNFTAAMRAGFQVVYYGSVIVFENDLLEVLTPSITKTMLGYGFSMLYDDYVDISCASIVVSGSDADVVIRLETGYGTVKYHKAKLSYSEKDWFLASFPVETNYEADK